MWAHVGQPGNIAASLPDASHPKDEVTHRGWPGRASCRGCVDRDARVASEAGGESALEPM